mmetsp:Transcript_44295/g.115109  ORF Transcript_44295/g.115109 Transcript_44295/m.115109 type:complete len:97 (+) Transcript_44295:915-1205(+)
MTTSSSYPSVSLLCSFLGELRVGSHHTTTDRHTSVTNSYGGLVGEKGGSRRAWAVGMDSQLKKASSGLLRLCIAGCPHCDIVINKVIKTVKITPGA